MNTDSLLKAINFLERLRSHPKMSGMHYGFISEYEFISEKQKWKATVSTGIHDDKPFTELHDWSERYDCAYAATLNALKIELQSLKKTIAEYKTQPGESYALENCKGYRRAILDTLRDFK